MKQLYSHNEMVEIAHCAFFIGIGMTVSVGTLVVSLVWFLTTVFA